MQNMRLALRFNDIKKNYAKGFRKYQNQAIAAIMALILGAGSIGISLLYHPEMPEPAADTETNLKPEEEETQAETLLAEGKETEPEESWIPVPTELNLAHMFADNADETDGSKSLAAEIFQELMSRDANWSSAVYSYSDVTPAAMAEKLGLSKNRILGKYNPEDNRHQSEDPSTWTIGSFQDVRIYAVDGDGHTISPYSNVKQIMAMANVYTYYHDPTDSEAFLSYAKALWEASHSYTMSISDVYYCSGCIGAQTEETEENSTNSLSTEGSAAMENTVGESLASSSNAEFETEISGTESKTESETESSPGLEVLDAGSESSPKQDGQSQEEATEPAGTDYNLESSLQCPGHVDLTITLKLCGLTETNGLFSLDTIGNDLSQGTENGWQGWTKENRQAAILQADEDWYQKYGLSISSISTGTPLTASEIEEYLDALPSDISETRKELLRFALNSVGKVPYYWGGKPSAPNYDGNHFGVLTSPDVDGRTLKGLDCSGWISWVYWSVTGERLAFEGTSGLVSLGTKVNREDLKPGDILIRTGEDSHVIMFLGWTSDGRIRCINETSGSVNNVTVSVRDAGWPYCRRLID